MLLQIAVGVLVICVQGLFSCFYMLYRNAWVFNTRIRIIEDGELHLCDYVDYDAMLESKIFCYDSEKFREQIQ